MITDDTILLTGPHGEELPGRVTFDGFDEDGVPTTGELQARDVEGDYHAVKQLEGAELIQYWQEFLAWADEAAQEELIHHRRAA